MRTFIAAPLPTKLIAPVRELVTQLRGTGADIKWVEENNLHVTLRFLGEIIEKDISLVRQSLQALTSFSRFQAELGTVGAFPSIASPRVIWLGLDRGTRELTELAEALEGELTRRGITPEEKRFHAHLTLGRQRTSHGMAALSTLLGRKPCLFGLSFEVSQVILFSSTLTPQGPIYRSLDTVQLKEPS